ncbi:hypothetical protein [Xanthomonas medicagonis]|uniref:hypothetical protein n=1 Tax=Xanthomonas medicagonis TaxID=3160841 RepID=UPI003515F80F
MSRATFADGARLYGSASARSRRLEGGAASLSGRFSLSVDYLQGNAIAATEEPVREVYHERDGDWQFLCGTTLDEKDLKLVCLGCMVETDHTIAELADLPAGWCATRQEPGCAWSRVPYDEDDEDA